MLVLKSAGIVQPGRADVHVNRPLTNISVAFFQQASNFVARQVFPRISVTKQSDLYFTIPRGAFFRNQMKRRAPATESAGGNYEIATDNYFAHVYAEHKDIADQVRANYDAPLNADRETSEYLTHQGLILNENEWRDTFFNPGGSHNANTGGRTVSDVPWDYLLEGTVAANLTPVNTLNPSSTESAVNNVTYWSIGGSTPIETIRLAKRTVLQNTGYMPNTLTMGRAVYDTLLDHSSIVGRIDSGQTPGGPAITSRQSLAAIFEVERILVMDAINTTSAEGATTETFDFIGGKHALLSYRPATPGLMVPSAGYTFAWTGFVGAGNEGMRIRSFRHELHEADRVEVEMAFDHKVVSSELGFFFSNIVQ